MLDRKVLVCLVATICARCSAYYLPGTQPTEFHWRQQMQAQVHSLVSAETELLFNYDTLPFCKPPRRSRISLRNFTPGASISLTGARIQDSPYNFSLLVEEHGKPACNGWDQQRDPSYGPLTDEEAISLMDKIRSRYRVKLMLDNLPVTPDELDEENPGLMRQGIDIGSEDNSTFYVNNHIMFKILVHRSNRTDHPKQLPRAESRMNFAGLEAVNVVEAEAVKAETVTVLEAEGGSRRLLADLEDSEEIVLTVEPAKPSATLQDTLEIESDVTKDQMTLAEAEAEVDAAMKPGGRVVDVIAALKKVENLKPKDDPAAAAFMVVRFEALACSIKRDPKKPIDKHLSCFAEGNPGGKLPDKQPVEAGADIVYTYDVFWEKSKHSWASRWDALA